MATRYIFKVDGMSCSHCERAVTDAVKKISGVKSVSASAPKGLVTVAGVNVNTGDISAAITEAGYSVTSHEESDDAEDDPRRESFSWGQFFTVGIIAALVLLIVHRTIGFSFIPQIPQNAGYGILFVAGILTSIHCVAMCGGIALSQCMIKDESVRDWRGLLRPFLYNAGRVVSYTLVGGIVGALGSVFDFSSAIKSGIMIGAGVLMAVMGLQMIGVFSFTSRLPVRLPRIVSKQVLHRFTAAGPFVVGIMNGFLPCGPLQTMQLFAFGTGSALHGALAMFIFSAGTVPLMFVLGAAGSVLSRRFTMTMYRAGGVLVIILGFMMFSNGMNLSGKRVFARSTDGAAVSTVSGNTQSVSSTMTSRGYQQIVIQKGIPVTWNIHANANDINGCNNAIVIPEYNIRKKLNPGDNIISFTPTKSGAITFTCWMGMISSSIRVVDNLSAAGAAGTPTDKASNAVPAGRSGTKAGLFGGSCCSRSAISQ
ncbi:MAG TPA: sulfite exporter TauE/SafE family protein [Spirochaetota bacterium]